MGLLNFLFGGSQPQPVTPQPNGGLLAPNAALTMNPKIQAAYRNYVIDTQSMGKPALSFNDWVKAQQPQAAQNAASLQQSAPPQVNP